MAGGGQNWSGGGGGGGGGGGKDAADQNFDYMFKLLIIGNSSVGKVCKFTKFYLFNFLKFRFNKITIKNIFRF